MNISDLLFQAELLEKAAEAIQELQSKLDLANQELSLQKQAQLNPVISSWKNRGFTEEEARGLVETVPSDTLQKVAKFADKADTFEMGGPSSRVAKGSDPMLDFLTS